MTRSLLSPLVLLVQTKLKHHTNYLLHQVLTAIYPAPTVALATGVVSVTTVPPAVAAPAQDIMNPSSPMATGVQGSAAAATPEPNVAVEVEPKVEVKRESQLDSHAEEGGYGLSSYTPASSLATCMINAMAGEAPLVLSGLVSDVSVGFSLLGELLSQNMSFNPAWSLKIFLDLVCFLT